MKGTKGCEKGRGQGGPAEPHGVEGGPGPGSFESWSLSLWAGLDDPLPCQVLAHAGWEESAVAAAAAGAGPVDGGVPAGAAGVGGGRRLPRLGEANLAVALRDGRLLVVIMGRTLDAGRLDQAVAHDEWAAGGGRARLVTLTYRGPARRLRVFLDDRRVADWSPVSPLHFRTGALTFGGCNCTCLAGAAGQFGPPPFSPLLGDLPRADFLSAPLPPPPSGALGTGHPTSGALTSPAPDDHSGGVHSTAWQPGGPRPPVDDGMLGWSEPEASAPGSAGAEEEGACRVGLAGWLDSVRLYERALSDQEVADLYLFDDTGDMEAPFPVQAIDVPSAPPAIYQARVEAPGRLAISFAPPLDYGDGLCLQEKRPICDPEIPRAYCRQGLPPECPAIIKVRLELSESASFAPLAFAADYLTPLFDPAGGGPAPPAAAPFPSETGLGSCASDAPAGGAGGRWFAAEYVGADGVSLDAAAVAMQAGWINGSHVRVRAARLGDGGAGGGRWLFARVRAGNAAGWGPPSTLSVDGVGPTAVLLSGEWYMERTGQGTGTGSGAVGDGSTGAAAGAGVVWGQLRR